VPTLTALRQKIKLVRHFLPQFNFNNDDQL
jgi:hypothetical protein